MTSFLDQTLTGFLDQAAARQPAPGGGSAAALTVALSAGLTAMAARFSAQQVEDSEELAFQADQLRHRAAALVDEDARAYQAVLDTRRDCGAGSSTAREAAQHAAIVPLQICELAGQTAALAARLATDGNPNLRGVPSPRRGPRAEACHGRHQHEPPLSQPRLAPANVSARRTSLPAVLALRCWSEHLTLRPEWEILSGLTSSAEDLPSYRSVIRPRFTSRKGRVCAPLIAPPNRNA